MGLTKPFAEAKLYHECFHALTLLKFTSNFLKDVYLAYRNKKNFMQIILHRKFTA